MYHLDDLQVILALLLKKQLDLT